MWEDNIKTDLVKIVREADSSGSGQSPVVGSCEHRNQQSGSLERDQDKLSNGLNRVGLFFSLH
jgi:hypothetical protein